ncbi:MAG: lytic transglycosylase domain-containing protein [Methylococcaceae bacterium]
MAGLLDFDRKTSLGLLMAGAQMMNTPQQQGGFGAIGNGLLGFAQGLLDQERQDREFARDEKKDARQSKMDDADMQLKQAQAQHYLSGGAGDGYHQPIQTSQGWAKWDKDTNEYKLIQLDGGVALPVAADVPLAFNKSQAQEAPKPFEYQDKDGATVKTTVGNAFGTTPKPGNYIPPRQTDLSGLPKNNSLAMADSLLNGLIKTESSGNPNAVSPKGAIGLTQIMPETARNPGYGVKPLQNNSPEENMRFGRDYLAALIQANGGDTQKALSAYNQGQGNLNKNGITNQGYVNSVLKNSGQEINLQNPITKPAVAGAAMAVQGGVPPMQAIDKTLDIARENVKDLEKVQDAAVPIYKGQTAQQKHDLETEAKRIQAENQSGIELKQKQAERVQEKADALPDTMADFDNLEKTVSEIEQHPGLSRGVGLIGKFARGFDGFAPHDFAVKAKQFGDQSFLAQIPKMKGFGQLTEAEGARLVSSLSTLGDPTQSEEQYRKEINSVRNWISTARERATKRAGGGQQPQASNGGWSIKAVE